MNALINAYRKGARFQFALLLLTGSVLAPIDVWPAGTCDTVTFSPAHFFPTGGSPLEVVVADFDGDSKQDFIVPNDSGVIVYLGDGLGGFLPPKTFSLGFHQFLTDGDFNGDGKLDLALPNNSGPSISIALNDGSGGFGPAASFAAGNIPRVIGVGDFNGDNKLDLAVANGGSDNVSILLGDGAGGFGPPTNFPAGNGPFAVAVGDFDGDSKLDLAVSTYDSKKV